MLKKIMFYTMASITLVRALMILGYLIVDPGALPVAVFISTGTTVLFGLTLMVKRHSFSSVSSDTLITYYAYLSVAVLFNAIFIALAYPAEIEPLEYLITGTITDILVNGTLIGFALRNKKYITIK